MPYADSLVEISDDALVLKHYYFPFGSRRLALSEIKQIAPLTPTLMNGRWRLWGTGSLRTWFALDWRRPFRDKIFLITLKDRWGRIGFTVEDSRRVEGLFRQKGLLAT